MENIVAATANISKQQRITIRITITAMVIIAFFALLNLYLNNILIAGVLSIQFLLCMVVYFLAFRKLIKQASVLMVVNAVAGISFVCSIVGKDPGVQYFLIPILFSIFALFSLKEKTILITGTLIVAGSWVFLELTEYSAFSQFKSDEMGRAWVGFLTFPIAILSSLAYMYYLVNENDRSEMKLQQNSNQLYSVINNTRDGIWMINRDYELIMYNEVFAKWCKMFFNYDIKPNDNLIEIIQKPRPDLAYSIKDAYDESLNNGTNHKEVKCYKFDNREMYFETTLNPIIENNEIVAVSCYSRDITEQKLLEKALISAKEKAESASHAKTMFLSKMSHELRTPLHGIYGITQLAMNDLKGTKHADSLKVVKDSTDHLIVLINDILDLSKIESGNFSIEKRPFNLQDTMNRLETTFKQKAKDQNIAFTVTMDSVLKDLTIISDPVRFLQVFSNLTENAIKFTNKGRVDVQLKLLSGINENLMLRGVVSDTGIGIPNDKKHILFENFIQIEDNYSRSFEGSGLGLAICKKLVNGAGGKIYFNSEEGKGSEFIFEWPVKIDSESAPESHPHEYQISGNGKSSSVVNDQNVFYGKKVLVVEDNEVNRLVAKRVLKQLSVDATLVDNGEAALKAIELEKFDAVLMDIQMPGMDGFEVTERIRKSGNGSATIPVIGVSANIYPETKRKAREAGFIAFIEKPFSIQTMNDTLKQCI